MSEKRVLIVCWDCNKHLSCPRVADRPLECEEYDRQPKRPGPERPPDRHWYKVVSVEVGEQVTDNTPLSAEERQAIAARAVRIAEMSTEDDCEYVESVLQLADSDIPRLQAHIEALELALEQRWNQWQTAEGRAEAAAKHIEVLEERLRFYAETTYADFDPATGECTMGEADIDRGQRAGEALK